MIWLSIIEMLAVFGFVDQTNQCKGKKPLRLPSRGSYRTSIPTWRTLYGPCWWEKHNNSKEEKSPKKQVVRRLQKVDHCQSQGSWKQLTKDKGVTILSCLSRDLLRLQCNYSKIRQQNNAEKPKQNWKRLRCEDSLNAIIKVASWSFLHMGNFPDPTTAFSLHLHPHFSGLPSLVNNSWLFSKNYSSTFYYSATILKPLWQQTATDGIMSWSALILLFGLKTWTTKHWCTLKLTNMMPDHSAQISTLKGLRNTVTFLNQLTDTQTTLWRLWGTFNLKNSHTKYLCRFLKLNTIIYEQIYSSYWVALMKVKNILCQTSQSPL